MPRTILHTPSKYSPSAKHYLIFFITGNPGLIGYYSSFLATLNQLFSSDFTRSEHSGTVYHILGQSLPGFEDNGLSVDPSLARSTPYGLQEQIDLTFEALEAQEISIGKRKGDKFDGIILVGHSVGAYILLELLCKVRQDASENLKVKAGVLLFPTITHIAQSPSGIRLTTLLHIPRFPRLMKMLVSFLFSQLPTSVLKWLITSITRMPPDATDITKDFLLSSMGVWQALHMAADEMKMITEDKWDQDIWGLENYESSSRTVVPKLVFYFGQDDNWVAEHTRDALIAARGQKEGDGNKLKPKMIIDQDNIPHGFCIHHGEQVAEKVKVWIDEITSGDRDHE